jgi:hypothetical protein
VRIDGTVSDYFEWLDAGRADILSYGGAMNIANPLVKTFFFGFDHDHFFLRIDTKKNARAYFENGFSLDLMLRSGAESWRGEIGFDGKAPVIRGSSEGSEGAVGRIIEWRIPFAALKMGEGSEFQLQLNWSFKGQPFQSIPALGPLRLTVPGAKEYAAFWQV